MTTTHTFLIIILYIWKHFFSLVEFVHADDDDTPSQVRLAYSGVGENGVPNGIAVMYYTEENTDSNVFYGISAKFDQHASGSSVNYLDGHGYHHTVLLPNLTAKTLYFYQVGPADDTRSETFTFTIPDFSRNRNLSIAIFGDLGYLDSKRRPNIINCCGLAKSWSAVYSRQVLEDWNDSGKLDFVWHIGDIGYADDGFGKSDAKVVEFVYEKDYNGFQNWMQNISSSIPYMVAVGNHEDECHSPNCVVNPYHGTKLSNFTAYVNRFRMPAPESSGNTNMWYSFDLGPVHFTTINTETNFPGAGEETHGESKIYAAGGFWGDYLGWLERDLKQARANPDVQWIIAGGHRCWDDVNTSAVPLFEKYNVDVYFSGHKHAYFRTYPMRNGTIDTAQPKNQYTDPKGTVYIVSGGPGNDEQELEQAMPETPNPMGADAVVSPVVSMGVLDVSPAMLRWTLINSQTRDVIDELIITKSGTAERKLDPNEERELL